MFIKLENKTKLREEFLIFEEKKGEILPRDIKDLMQIYFVLHIDLIERIKLFKISCYYHGI